MKFLVAALALLILTSPCIGQSISLDAFTVSANSNNEVVLNWTMSVGAICTSPQLQRSRDNKNFTTFYTYPGVCGSSAEAQSYQQVDNDPILYAVSYYRIKLSESEFSEVKSVNLQSELKNAEVIIAPNPAVGQITIKCRKELGEQFDLQVFDRQGKLVMEREALPNREQLINLLSLKSGTYSMVLRFNTGKEIQKPLLIR
jgi:hypothetical protein